MLYEYVFGFSIVDICHMFSSYFSHIQLAVKLQQSEISSMGSGGRVASLLRDEGNALNAPAVKSIYRADPSESTSSPSASSRYGALSSASVGVTSGTSGGESFQARDKYANAKGISSDQFFGIDDEHAEQMRTRLDKYSGASAISSDMVYHGAKPQDYSLQADGGIDLNRLKDSVKDFFQNMG